MFQLKVRITCKLSHLLAFSQCSRTTSVHVMIHFKQFHLCYNHQGCSCQTLRSCQILKPVVQCPCYADCRPHIYIDFFWSLDYRRSHFGWGFAILLHPCPYMMNTATMFLICQKDPSFLGFVQHSNSLWLWYRVHALWHVFIRFWC